MCAGSLVVLSLGVGCGGSDDRPDLAASTTTLEQPAAVQTPGEVDETHAATRAGNVVATRVSPRVSRSIATRAGEIETAVANWDDRLAACVGPSGEGDDAGATCTRAAWEQLFDQMDVAQYYLLRLVRPLQGGSCHESLAEALDAVHGFLSGATPTKVVWLDEQQRPPSGFDLAAIVDLVRPVPAKMRAAAMTACRS